MWIITHDGRIVNLVHATQIQVANRGSGHGWAVYAYYRNADGALDAVQISDFAVVADAFASYMTTLEIKLGAKRCA